MMVGWLKWFEILAWCSSVPCGLPGEFLLFRFFAAVQPIASIVAIGVNIHHPAVFAFVAFCSFDSAHIPSPWQRASQPVAQPER
jgi:hypothetical protein